MPSDPELQTLIDQISALERDVQTLTGPLTESQFRWRPHPGGWSVAECIEHLDRSIAVYLPVLDHAIDKARAQGITGTGPFRYSALGRLMLWGIEPPYRMKVKTFAPLSPTLNTSKTDTVAAYLARHRDIEKRMKESSGLDWKRIRIESPLIKRIKLELGVLFACVTAHERRHVWQAHQVRDNAAFPGV